MCRGLMGSRWVADGCNSWLIRIESVGIPHMQCFLGTPGMHPLSSQMCLLLQPGRPYAGYWGHSKHYDM